MSLYVFVGATAMIWADTNNNTPSTTFDHFGQTVDLDDVFVHEKVRHEGLQLLPKSDFDALQFTADELKKYPTRDRQMDAPAQCKQKFAAADTAFKHYRQSLSLSEVHTDAGHHSQSQI